MQTTYEKLLDGRARFDGRSSFKTWLFAVIRNTAGSARRRRLLDPRRWWREPAATHAPALEGEHARSRVVQLAVSALAVRQREVIELVFYGEMTVEDAARVMGVSPGTARVHYDRGKRRLRKALGEVR